MPVHSHLAVSCVDMHILSSFFFLLRQTFSRCTCMYLIWIVQRFEPQGRRFINFLYYHYHYYYYYYYYFRSGELRTQKLKSHLVRILSLNVLPLKPGVGQWIAIHATLTARNFFLVYFYLSSRFICIFSPKHPLFFRVLAVTNTWFLCRPAE